MVTKCCLPNCDSTYSYHKERKKIHFHRFPANQKLKQKWLSMLGIESVRSSDRICGLHFTVNDYTVSGSKRFLKKCALPLVYQVKKENVSERKYLQDSNAILLSHVKNGTPFGSENFENSDHKIKYTALPDYISKAVSQFILPPGNLDGLKIYNNSSNKQKLHGFKLSTEDQFILVLTKI